VTTLLLESYEWLALGEAGLVHVTHVLRAFEVKLVTLVGFGPSLDACALCGRPDEAWGHPGPLAFSPAAGGLVCPACRAGDPPGSGAGHSSGSQVGHLVLLSPGTVKAMRFLAGATHPGGGRGNGAGPAGAHHLPPRPPPAVGRLPGQCARLTPARAPGSAECVPPAPHVLPGSKDWPSDEGYLLRRKLDGLGGRLLL